MTPSRVTIDNPTDFVCPRTWLLTSDKVGDNNQVLALAEALGWPWERKRIVRRDRKIISKMIHRQLFGITLVGIDRERSCPLEPPWPDLVISASRANEMVARWIGKKSGGRCRLVHIGRPKSPLDAFDLIITTPQYFLPQRSNILYTQLPLHRVTDDRLKVYARHWRPKLAHLPRPYTAVLVGGNSGKCVLSGDRARQLGRLVNNLALARGGSVLATDSARTPPTAFSELVRQLTVPAYVYQWSGGAGDNPFYGYLALADQLVVTADSASMLAEASATGKPVFMFDLSDKDGHGSSGRSSQCRDRKHGLIGRLAPCFREKRIKRDIGHLQQLLLEHDRATWLGKPRIGHRHTAVPEILSSDLQRAATRVRLLVRQSYSG